MIKSLINKLLGNKPTATVSPSQPVVPNTTHKHTVAGNSHQRRIARRKAQRSEAQDKVDQRDFSDYPTLINRRES